MVTCAPSVICRQGLQSLVSDGCFYAPPTVQEVEDNKGICYKYI